MTASHRTLVGGLYRDILFREADGPGLEHYTAQLADGHFALHQVEEALRTSPEYTCIVQPLVQHIGAMYSTFLFREPTVEEVRRSLNGFRHQHTTFERGVQAIQSGESCIDLGIRPLNLEMDITNQCNLRCIMCYFSDERIYKRKREDISTEEFASIADQIFPLCHKVSLSIATEPLLHRQFGELLEIAAPYKVPRIYMNTNGLLFTAGIIDQLIASKFHAIAISIDAATKETYEQIRVGSHFEKVIANIHAINRAKERTGTNLPHLTFNFVLMRRNIEELPALVRLAHELQVEGIAAVHMVPYDNTNTLDESLQGHRDLCNRMLDEARAAASRHNVALSLPANFIECPHPAPQEAPLTPTYFDLNTAVDGVPRSCCQFPWHFVGIDCYGNVVPCGWWYNEPPMGNIKTERFDIIWNNERYRHLRAEHATGALRPTCATCPAAGVGAVTSDKAFQVKKPGLSLITL
jgi:radical SAM protein with 4Fe4S-binding SPASM domain